VTHGSSATERSSRWFERIRVSDLVVWYAISAVLVYALPSLARFGSPPWALSPREELQAWYWMSAFLVAALGVTVYRAIRGAPLLTALGLFGIAPWFLALLALWLRADISHSRLVGLGSFVLGSALLIAPATMPSRVLRLAARVATLLVGVGVVAMVVNTRTARPTVAPSQRDVVSTALIPLTVTYEPGLVPRQRVRGGAMVRLGPGFLLVTAVGEAYSIAWDSAGDRLTSRQLPIPAPMSREGVVVDVGRRAPFVRVTGLALDTSLNGGTVYAAHEVWRPDDRCVAVQVSSMRMNGTTPADSAWRPVYTTQPCVKPVDPFENGGRLLLMPDHSLLLTVGDYGINQEAATAPSQQRNSDYGKVLRIGLDGTRRLHTLGHRNPQGITSDRVGRLWLAEHGPRGGDEINLLEEGSNYGWPLATYGTVYGTYAWRFSPPTGTHSGFKEPALAFVPAVGISSLITVQGRLFESWRGDLLAGSLVGEQLLRVRVSGDRAVYAEPIPIGRRVRDVVEGEDGRIVLWTDGGDLVWLAPAPDLLSGSIAYGACVQCHGLRRDGTPFGPSLRGVIGRDVASVADFEYSPALKKAGGRWTEKRLDAFLKDPSAFARGTTMESGGIADSAQRRALMEYLRR